MKAFKCDRCGMYHDHSAVGIFYDNTDLRRGIRYDLCHECTDIVLGEILQDVEHEKAETEEA